MITRDRSNLLKNLLVLGAASASLFVSIPALSQTSSESETPAPGEIKMSAEGMRILCENFPLNSRCQGGEQPTAVPSAPMPREESASPETSTEPSSAPSLSPDAPSEMTPSEPSETTVPEPSGSMSPSEDKPGMTAPSVTPDTPGMPSAPKPQSSNELSPAAPSLSAPSLSSPSPAAPSLSAPSSAEPTAPTTAPGLTPSTSPNSPSVSPTTPGTAPKGQSEAPSAQTPATGAQATPASPRTPAAPNAAPNSAPSRGNAPVQAPAPGAAPASPQAPSAAPAAPATPVSEAELQKFAKVIPQLQEIQQSAQQQVSDAIQEAGLSEDRFRELYTAQQPNAGGAPQAASTPATPQEREAVQTVVTQLETIKNETQTRREQAVTSQGLQLNRFNEILTAVRQDADLQQQLQQMLSN